MTVPVSPSVLKGGMKLHGVVNRGSVGKLSVHSLCRVVT